MGTLIAITVLSMAVICMAVALVYCLYKLHEEAEKISELGIVLLDLMKNYDVVAMRFNKMVDALREKGVIPNATPG